MTKATNQGSSVMTRSVIAWLLGLGMVVMSAPLARAACDDPASPGVDWDNCDKSGVDLKNADLSGASMRHINLAGADLSGANLNAAKLMSANLKDAKLDGANLEGAHLSSAIWPDGGGCGWYSVGVCKKKE
jgi:hypothetical protein